MRRLMFTRRPRMGDERGAIGVIVAVAMVALFGFTAIALDMGALYAERAQLQNGADAAALAIAQDCADGACTNLTATAQSFANANANDGAANVATPTVTGTSVTVAVTTRDADTGAGSLALTFAPVLGIDAKSVSAQSTASWGSPATGPAVLALAFAPCVFKLDGAVQVISMHGDSGGASCSSTSSSGQLLPGGFGWLADSSGTCTATASAGANSTLSSSTGVSLPAGCQAVLASLANKTVLLPVYSGLGGTGSTAWYTIRGWAAFKVLGWNFPGFSYNNQTYANGPGSTDDAYCKGSCKGLIGQFISFVSLDDRFTTGGPSLGTAIVRLTN